MSTLKNPLEEAGNDFIRQLDLFDMSIFNIVPFEGSWTPAQVGEHIRKSNEGMVNILTGPSEETKRSPGEMIERIKNALLDYSVKMKSPDFIVPESKPYNKKELTNALKDLQNTLVGISEHNDLTKTCIGFQMPKLGYLTGMEIISFIIFHTQRHSQQLSNMHAIHQNIHHSKLLS